MKGLVEAEKLVNLEIDQVNLKFSSLKQKLKQTPENC